MTILRTEWHLLQRIESHHPGFIAHIMAIQPETAVSRGMALLDEFNLGWEARIDLRRFTIDDTQNCILGQLYGNYPVGRSILRVLGGFFPMPSVWQFDHGFCAVGAERCADLTQEWKCRIATRRLMAAAAVLALHV